MHRSEKRNGFVGYIMALLLLAMIPACLLRLSAARPYLTTAQVEGYTGKYATVLDRSGGTLRGNGQLTSEIVSDVVGEDNKSNTLLNAYGQELTPSLNILGGVNAAGEAGTMVTTLLELDALEAIAAAFGGKGGACYAYNYATGEVLCMISLDGERTFYTNRCIMGLYTPGSTMKVVTSIIALEQDPNLPTTFSHECTGQLKLPKGVSVKCAGVHYATDFHEALGQSCNSSYGAIAASLNPAIVRSSLERMGFGVKGSDSPSVEKVGILTKSRCSTLYVGDGSYDDIWGLIGQGKTQVNLMTMAQIAGAVAGGGEAAEPYLVSTIRGGTGRTTYTAETTMKRLFSADTAELMAKYWREAYTTYYTDGSRELSDIYSFAKTGTAQLGGGNEDKLLLGVSESHQVAFMIVVENYRSGDPTPNLIANTLARYLPAPEGE